MAINVSIRWRHSKWSTRYREISRYFKVMSDMRANVFQTAWMASLVRAAWATVTVVVIVTSYPGTAMGSVKTAGWKMIARSVNISWFNQLGIIIVCKTVWTSLLQKLFRAFQSRLILYAFHHCEENYDRHWIMIISASSWMDNTKYDCEKYSQGNYFLMLSRTICWLIYKFMLLIMTGQLQIGQMMQMMQMNESISTPPCIICSISCTTNLTQVCILMGSTKCTWRT